MPKQVASVPRVVCNLENLSAHQSENYIIELPEEEAHHLINVMRLKVGDPIEVICRTSHKKYSANIFSAQQPVTARIISQVISAPMLSRVSTLLFAHCKGDTNDLVAEKCCELGVGRLIFWQARHSVAKIKGPEEKLKKEKRWNKICEAAAKQCGNPNITQVSFAPSLAAAIEDLSAYSESEDIKLCCSLSSSTTSMNALSVCKRLHIAIGPEGDFSQEEEELLRSHDFCPTSLGPLTLRAETAALAAVAAANALWGFTDPSSV